jgi:SAM-dependent methyltransferase
LSTPATWGWKRRAADALARAHALRPAISLYQTALGVKGALGGRDTISGNTLPVPSAQLRVRVGPSHADLETFLTTGEQHARLVEDLLATQQTTPETTAPILDFGCGCGRVARHWQQREVDLHGCDVNPRMIEWCRRHLAGQYDVNRLDPPLPYAGATFGLAYAFSVFTHLPEQMQLGWLGEFQRVLRPGGYLLFSTLGEHYVGLNRLTESERELFDRGGLVVLFERHPGESFCSAYHPRQYVERTLAARFDYVHYRRGDSVEAHDFHLLRKPELATSG